jgi:hypothetical protein
VLWDESPRRRASIVRVEHKKLNINFEIFCYGIAYSSGGCAVEKEQEDARFFVAVDDED